MPLSSSHHHQDQACVSLMGEEEDDSTRKEDDATEVKTGENESRDLLRNPRLVLFTVICVPVLIIFVIVLVNLTEAKGGISCSSLFLTPGKSNGSSLVLDLPSLAASKCLIRKFPIANKLRAAMAEVYDDKVTVCGGRDEEYSDSCFSLQRGHWEPGPTLLVPRAYGASVILPDGSLWISGGSKSFSDYLSSSEILVSGSSVWVKGPELPTPVSFHCMLQFNSSHTFVAGGYSDAGSYSEAYFYYDGIFHQLSEMLTPRSHHMCARYKGEIILAGGWHPGYDYMDTVEIFNPELNRWRTGPKLPTPIGSGALITAGDQLLVLGGMVGWTEKNKHIFALEYGDWAMKGVLEESHVFFSALCVDDNITNC